MDDAVLSLEEALKNKTFLVKSYQRGYRWTDTHVDALLQDIADFAKSGKEHESYFLQPVIVKSLKQKDGSESWELIDGQQRLTTIFLMDAVLCRALNRSSAFPSGYATKTGKKAVNFCVVLPGNQSGRKVRRGRRNLEKIPTSITWPGHA
ncbi:DUF262 domain-containing protein [uncultured Mailhella sp.]|uniref:DUF262 domain-containing protein n=1 Tax=uncultured Mailhella sp. TaxID=1981031 RepID=UPI0032092E17